VVVALREAADAVIASSPGTARTLIACWEARAADLERQHLKPQAECFRITARELAALSRGAEPRQGWQPIETAPKGWDGTQLLVADDQGRINRAFWYGSLEDGHWMMVGGQWEPTHWMPLPDPPTAAALSGEAPAVEGKEEQP
jgi:hypothetical protein